MPNDPMISKTAWFLRHLLRRMWVRTVALALLSVIAALAGTVLAPIIPDTLASRLGADAVGPILTILASSMLAVVTFSLSVAVQAQVAAASSATPRATQLLQEDRTTQNVLSLFVGAFLFSLVGIIALRAGLYADRGRVILFAATVLVVALVVIALLRWIAHLMEFGRVRDTLARVERVATEALASRSAEPFLGGARREGAVPDDATPVFADVVGYVQYLDIAALQACADDAGVDLWLAALPGSYVHPGEPLLAVTGGAVSDDDAARLRRAFSVSPARSFDQDPRFGLIVLAEIASRALSPAVNDPGTAIDVIGRLVRVLSHWRGQTDEAPRFPRVHVPPIAPTDLIEDAFHAIGRDGAALIEVQIRLQKALAAVAAGHPEMLGAAARAAASEAAARARAALANDADRHRLEAVTAE